jgi:hypothetical protein
MHRTLSDSNVLIKPDHISTAFGAGHMRINIEYECLCENFRMVNCVCILLGNVEENK